MKRVFSVLLVLILVLGGVRIAYAKQIGDIIRLEGVPARYLVEYSDADPLSWDWDSDEYWDLVDADGSTITANFAQNVYKTDGGWYNVEIGGLYGVMDGKGNFLTEPCYTYIYSDFRDGLCLVKQNGLYGYIGEDFKLAIDPRFEDADEFWGGLARVKQNGLYGYIGTDGEYVAEPVFDRTYGFENGRVALVVMNGKYGLIDKSGVYLAEPNYNVSGWNADPDGYFQAEIYEYDSDMEKRYGILFDDGSVIEPRFQEIFLFGEEKNITAAQANGLWGYIDRSGEYVIEPVYEDCSTFEDGLAAVRLNGLWGFINESGEYVLEPQFEYVSTAWYFEQYTSVVKDGLYGAIRSDGSYVVPPQYEWLGGFYDGYAETKQNGLFGLIDESGNWVVEPVYAVIGDRNEVCAVVSMDKDAAYWDVYDRAPGAGLVSLPEGKLLLELGHDNISIAYGDGTVLAEKDGVSRVYTISGGEIREVATVDSLLDLSVYLPNEGERVAVLDGEADIRWNEEAPLPRLDGATALLPVYAAFAQATYPDTLRYTKISDPDDGEALFACTKTNKAYDRLIDGDTDIIFCAGPSAEETLLAKLKGLDFELTLIGYEAFVFIVNADNPVTGVTVEQIRDIYSGKTLSWAELGYPELGSIVAYQRPVNSGSQTALEKLMGNVPLTDAPEYVAESMVGIVENIEYRNFENSIGYSFRFFVSGMMNSDVKMLAIDGVAPTEDNIRNGTYPLITPVYAVTIKGEANPNVQIFLNWICGPQGQELLEKSGYVGR